MELTEKDMRPNEIFIECDLKCVSGDFVEIYEESILSFLLFLR